MALQSPLIMKQNLPPKPAEVMSKTQASDKKGVEKYMVKTKEEEIDFSIPYMDADSKIDLQLLIDSEEEFQRFSTLLDTWGCFQLVNHGITSTKLEQVRQVTKEFFELPLEEKEKYRRATDRIEGWGGDKMSENQAFSWNDRLILRIYPFNLRNPKLWPDECVPKFREIIEEYSAELKKIGDILFNAVTKLLKLPEDNLISKYGKEGILISRFNYYPPSPFPEKIEGLKAHSDVNFFTILLQDPNVEGLHIEKDDQWFRVPIVPDALLVNIADIMEILSNGRLKAVFHRAVTNGEKKRLSVAFAFAPPKDAEVEPLKELIDEEHPQLYPKFSNYLSTTSDYYAKGQRTLKMTNLLSNPPAESENVGSLEFMCELLNS